MKQLGLDSFDGDTSIMDADPWAQHFRILSFVDFGRNAIAYENIRPANFKRLGILNERPQCLYYSDVSKLAACFFI